MTIRTSRHLELLDSALADMLRDLLPGRSLSSGQLASILADWVVGPGRPHVTNALAQVAASRGFECPTCHAAPGDPCFEPATEEITELYGNLTQVRPPHPSRQALADQPVKVGLEVAEPSEVEVLRDALAKLAMHVRLLAWQLTLHAGREGTLDHELVGRASLTNVGVATIEAMLKPEDGDGDG